MNGDGTTYVLYDISSLFAIVLKYDATQQAYQLGAYINGENRFTNQYIPANEWSHVSCVYKKSRGRPRPWQPPLMRLAWHSATA